MKAAAPRLRRRALLVWLAAVPALGLSQTVPAEPDAAIREAVRDYAQAWSRRDVEGWLRLHADDVLYIDPHLNEKRGHQALSGYIRSMMALYDLRVEIERIAVRPGGTEAIAVLRVRYGELPRNQERYVREFDRSGIFSRWRLEGGSWRIVQFADSTTRSTELLKSEKL